MERSRTRGSFKSKRKKAWWRTTGALAGLLLLLVTISVAVGVGLGIGLKSDDDESRGAEAVAGLATGAGDEPLSDAYLITGATHVDGTVSSYTYTSFASSTTWLSLKVSQADRERR